MNMRFYQKMAWSGMKKNGRLYIPYLLTCVGMVMMSYILQSLGCCSLLENMRGGGNIKVALNLGKFVVAVFALIFLIYTNSFLVRRRNREFGLYHILGMDKKGIRRFGSCILPMDETLVMCAIDLSGRPYLQFDAEFTTDRVGYMDTEMVKEFFYAISYSAGMNLHIKVLSPGNNHHMIEAMFKAFAKALDAATRFDPRITDVFSTKGTL